jgi:hypothetical protein
VSPLQIHPLGHLDPFRLGHLDEYENIMCIDLLILNDLPSFFAINQGPVVGDQERDQDAMLPDGYGQLVPISLAEGGGSPATGLLMIFIGACSCV